MKKWPWFLLVVFIVTIDQTTKYLSIMELLPYQSKAILPMLNFTLAYNTGAAFSFLNSAGNWHYLFFITFSSVMSIVLIIWIVRSTDQVQLLALSLILSGALGNLIDRFNYGHVIDFIDVYYKTYHWPIFNVADTAVCIGAFLLMVRLFKSS